MNYPKINQTHTNLLTALTAISLSTGIAMADKVAWPLSEGGNGHEYEVVLTPDGMNWSDARAAAEAAGGHLATVSNMDELDFINSLDFAGTSKGWIGGYQDMNASDYSEPYGGWKWVTGESWSFVGWWEGGPSSSPTRNYVQLAYTKCQDEIDVDNEGEWYVIEYEAHVPRQWATADGGNGHWYEAVLVGSYLSWEEASELAISQGGHLATPSTENEDQWIINNLLNDDALWGYNNNYAFGPHIGGRQNFDSPDYSEPGGGWEWMTGELFGYTNWTGLDNCCGGQDRMQYYKLNDAIGWDDVALTRQDVLFKSYLIEWSADCNGDGIVDYGQILNGTLEDLDGDGVPDICDAITVAVDGSGDYTDIQSAIDAAAQDAEILVYPGVYTGNGTEVVRLMGKNIQLRSLNGPELTIIDGENTRRCLVASDGESSLEIEGFTLANGKSDVSGGGMFTTSYAKIRLQDMVFANNSSGWEGGGLNIGNAENLELHSCQFIDNQAFAGGGMAVTSTNDNLIDGCLFQNNQVIDDGAGLLVQQCTGMLVENSEFVSNFGDDDGGAMWIASSTQILIEDCTMTGNTVTGRAGGVHVQSGAVVSMLNCVLEENVGHNGGGAFVDSTSSLAVTGCQFMHNAGDGGAIQAQGGTLELEQSEFVSNSAFDGGAIYCWNATLDVHECKFKDNHADDDGGAMLLGGGTQSSVTLTLFCGNAAPNGQHVLGSIDYEYDNTYSDQCGCPSDVNQDGEVNVNDILTIIANFGTPNVLGDVDENGFVDVNDLLLTLGSFGQTCG